MKDLLLTAAQKERLIKSLASGSRLDALWYKYKNIIHSYALEAIKLELAEPDFAVQTNTGYAVFFFEKDV